MESGLAYTHAFLRSAVGNYLGYGRGLLYGDNDWDTHQLNNIKAAHQSGLNQFYYPPFIGAESGIYEWTFMKPVATIPLNSGGSVVRLPDDFGGFNGPATLYTTESQVAWEIPETGEQLLRERFSARPNETGRPSYMAVRPVKGTGPMSGQRYDLVVWPVADGDFTLQVAYFVCPEATSDAVPYHLGGAQHAETVLASCLAAAEWQIMLQKGVHDAKFKERLAASVMADRKLKPKLFGQNLDRSDGRNRSVFHPHELARVTVNGVQH